MHAQACHYVVDMCTHILGPILLGEQTAAFLRVNEISVIFSHLVEHYILARDLLKASFQIPSVISSGQGRCETGVKISCFTSY